MSHVAAVIHAASDQALRYPEQTDETGGDNQQSQGSGCGVDVAMLNGLPPDHHWKSGPTGIW